MPDLSDLGRMLMVAGVALLAVGALLAFLGRSPTPGSFFGWLGRLPGDVLIKRDHFTFYFPLVTSIVISVVLSLLLYFFSRR
jgi:hypothetical protein